jgi:hypothetical protein
MHIQALARAESLAEAENLKTPSLLGRAPEARGPNPFDAGSNLTADFLIPNLCFWVYGLSFDTFLTMRIGNQTQTNLGKLAINYAGA